MQSFKGFQPSHPGYYVKGGKPIPVSKIAPVCLPKSEFTDSLRKVEKEFKDTEKIYQNLIKSGPGAARFFIGNNIYIEDYFTALARLYNRISVLKAKLAILGAQDCNALFK